MLIPHSEQGSKSAQKTRLLTIWFGANDAALENSVQHVPIAEYSSNTEKLIDMVSNPSSKWYSPSTQIILLTPPPLNSNQHTSGDRTFEITKKYAEALCKVGEKKGVPVVNVWQALYDAAKQKEVDLKKFLSDGLHLTSEGYEVRSQSPLSNWIPS